MDSYDQAKLPGAEESDEDGFGGSVTSDAVDELYLDGGDHDQQSTYNGQSSDFKIDHQFGDFELEPSYLASQVAAPSFDGTKALEMFQRRLTIDYGKRKVGSKPASPDDTYHPIFHLDMIVIIGRPLLPITSRSRFFDNVIFSFQNWQAPYTSKHIASNLPFQLRNRTFRIAVGASRELWFVVMHPTRPQATDLPPTRSQRRKAQILSGQSSAILRHHAEILASYITGIFGDGELLGEGVEPSWVLNGKQTQSLSYDKWTIFQQLFMDGWSEFSRRNSHDSFWTDNQPAFHTYDHGANIEIEVNGPLYDLDQETRLRPAYEDSDGQSCSSGSEEGGDISVNTDIDAGSWGGFDDDGDDDDSFFDDSGDGGSSNEGQGTDAPDHVDTTLYSDGLEQLRSDLEKKYLLENIEQVSYAVAADLHCVKGGTGGTTICLLSDRSKVFREYRSQRDFTFYPMAFHPRYGNFSSPNPPAFLHDLCMILRDNMSYQNGGADVLSFGFFQGYTNIKRAIRSRSSDLLATRGIATAALTLPPSEAGRSAHIRAQQQKLLQILKGELTPEEPDYSMPFARERQRIEASIREDQLAFRMEQVVTIRTSRLEHGRQHFHTVLQPIFQLIRFFLHERSLYITVLKGFRPKVFPQVLCTYARLFELAIGEMRRRYERGGDKGLDLASSEAVAVLDRLGSFCFTGDARVLPTTVLRPLLTMESINKGAWPFVCPSMLDFREAYSEINAPRWPQTADQKPALLHVAALAYHYGPVTAAHRHSQVWFGELGSRSIQQIRSAAQFLEEVFRSLWVPQTVSFIAHKLRQKHNRGSRSGKAPTTGEIERRSELNRILEGWIESDEPFSMRQYELLFGSNISAAGNDIQVTTRTRYDFAAYIYKACKSSKKSSRQAVSSIHATWSSILEGALQNTDETAVSGSEWIDALMTVIASVGIEWAPGEQRKKITANRIVHLIGYTKSNQILAARPGSLKRAAMEAEMRQTARSEQRAKRRTPRERLSIDLGQEIPFDKVPQIISGGFASLNKIFAKGNQGILNHYQVAHNCLVDRLGDPLVDLMLILTVTMASCSVTPHVAQDKQGFGAATQRKDPALLAANMVTRMLWYLRPQAFPWGQDERGVLRVQEMTKKIEHKGVSNRVLRELGWITARTSRGNPRNSECELREEGELMELYKELLMLQRKDARGFILRVFKSKDDVWVERCMSIVKES